MAAEAVSAGFKGLDKLESYAKKPVERWRMVKDNKKQMRDLLVMYNNDLEELEEVLNTRVHDVDDEDRHIKRRLAEFKGRLEDRRKELHLLQSSVEVEGAKILLSVVRRNREVMNECETLVNTYRDYYETSVRTARERMADAETASERAQTVETTDDRTANAIASEPDSYVPFRNILPTAARLTLDYSTTNTCEGRLKAEVVRSLEGTGRIVGVVAVGIGGVGKTCAMLGLARDKQIRERFPDGILLIQLGNDSHLSDVIEGIAKCVERTGGKQLGRRIRGLETVAEASEKAGQWFGDRKCLFLVDDVWEVHGISPSEFGKLGCMLNDQSLLVYTTRTKRFLEVADKQVPFEAREAHGELARRMLMNHADIGHYSELNSDNKEAVNGILGICQGLPLALGIAGSTVRSYWDDGDNIQDAWKIYYDDLKSNEESIVDGSTELYGRVVQIVESSLSVLDSEPWFEKTFTEMFRRLCVLQKQQGVGGHVLQKLWNVDDMRRTRRIAELFAGVSIIRMVRRGGTKFSVWVHDLVLDIAETMAVKKNEKNKWFKMLLNSYSPRKASTDFRADMNASKESTSLFTSWWDVDDDGFIHDNICRVLHGANETNQLFWLLERAQWIVPRLRKSGISGVEEDLRIGMQVLDKKGTEETEVRSYLKLVGNASRMSCVLVAGNAYEAWFQLYGRMVWYAEHCIRTRKFVSEIEEHSPRPWVKPSIGILEEAGGARSERIHIESCLDIHCVWNGEDVTRILWNDSDRQEFVTEYNKTYGTTKAHMLGSVGVDKDSSGDVERHSASSDTRSMVEECTGGAFSDNQQRLVTKYRNGNLIVWDVDHGYKVVAYHKCSGEVNFVAISGDGKIVAYGLGRSMWIWDTSREDDTGNPFEALEVQGGVKGVDVSFDGKRVVCRSVRSFLDGDIHLWNRDVGGAMAVPPEMQNVNVRSVTISGDGKRVVSRSRDGTIRIWNVGSTAGAVRSMRGHDKVQHAASNADGTRIVSASYDHKVCVWDVETGAMIGQPLEVGYITGVSISPDGKQVATWRTRADTVQVFDPEKMSASLRPERFTGRVLCVAYDGHGTQVVSGSYDGRVRVWDRTNGQLIAEAQELHAEWVSCVAVSADGGRIVSGGSDGSVRVWDANCDAVAPPLEKVGGKHLVGIHSVAVNNDGTRVLFSSSPTGVFVWDVRSGDVTTVTRDVTHSSVAMSCDGARVAFTSGDCRYNEVTVWDVHARRAVASPLTGHTESIWEVVFSGDGTRVLSASNDGTVRVWDADSGTAIGNPLVHGSPVDHVQSNVDGSIVVSYDDRGYGLMWHVGRGECVITSADADWISTLHHHGLVPYSTLSTRSRITRHTEADNEKLLASTDTDVNSVGDLYFSGRHGAKFWPFATIVT